MKIAFRFLTLLGCFVISLFAAAQSREMEKPYIPASKELYDTIAKMDSLMFAAFNAHDLEKIMSYFSEDLEFYHDKGGLSDYKRNRELLNNLFETNKTSGLRRDIIKGSLEVYPVKDYGAIEVCRHRFCHKENGRDDCGVFKNVMVWKRENGQWKVTRVISFDH